MSKKVNAAIETLKTELIQVSELLAYCEFNMQHNNCLLSATDAIDTRKQATFYRGKQWGIELGLTTLGMTASEVNAISFAAETDEKTRCNLLMNSRLMQSV